MDWTRSGRLTTYEYVRVNRVDMSEIEILSDIQNGGSIAYNDLTALKVSGSIPYIVPPDIGNDYLRIYSVSSLDGETVRTAHGTFIISAPTSTITGKRRWFDEDGEMVSEALRPGTASLYSLLQILEELKVQAPFQVVADTTAVTRAVELATSVGLSIIADESTSKLINDVIFDAGTSYLEVVNWLLKYAGFDTAEVDGYGNVLMRRYHDPTNSAPVITFEEGAHSVFMSEIAYEFELFDVPNQVLAVMSNQDGVMTATATNTDPDNRYSTVSRGRTITHVEDVSQIDSQAALDELAAKVLASKTSAVESIEIEHVYQPFDMGQGVRVIYHSGDLDFIGVAVSQTKNLTQEMICNTRFRRFIRF